MQKKTNKMYKCVLGVLCLSLFLLPASGFADTWKYDFGKDTDTARAGYTHVDNTTAYSVGQGYGIVDNSTGKDATASNWSSVASWDMTDLVATAVTNLDSELFFQLDVPNGDYLVTVGAGNPKYDDWMKIFVNGVEYSGNSNNTNLYVLDTAPVGGDPWDTTSTWQEDPYDVHSVDANGFVRTWGWTRTYSGGQFMDADILYLKQEEVSVTDGKITAYGACSSGWGMLNFIEVQSVPEPVTSFVMLAGSGIMLLRRRKRCN